MAIIDNDFTAEELQAALTAKPELAQIVTSTLGSTGFKVIEPDKYEQFLSTEREQVQGTIRSKIYGDLNKDIAGVAGFEKEGDEKTYDYAKRAISTYKTQAEEFKQRAAELEEKIKNNTGDETLKAQLEAWKQKEADWLKEKETTKQTLFEKDVDFELTKGLSKFKPKPGIDQELVDLKIETEKANLIKSAKRTESGKIVFTDAAGNIILNKDTTEAADAEYILNERLKNIKDTGHKQEGAGTNGQGGSSGSSDTSIPQGLKTRLEVTRALIKAGILSGTKEFDKAVAEYPGYDKMPSGV